MFVSMGLFSGLSKVSTVPAGSAANAALVGAKTVNGPGPLSVSTRPAAFTAATSVVWSLELTALSMMSLVGYIGAPPTILVVWTVLEPLPVSLGDCMPERESIVPAQAPSRVAAQAAAIRWYFIRGTPSEAADLPAQGS